MNDNIFELAAAARPGPNRVFVSLLALERCQQQLAHLHALLHLCLPEDTGDDTPLMASLRQLIAGLNRELSYSVDTLAACED
jgi:hypothetical protein